MLPIKLFRFVFCSFRFNRNIETLCFGIEAKQPKQTLCFGQCRNKFRFQFRLFRIETSFEGHPNCHQSIQRSELAHFKTIQYRSEANRLDSDIVLEKAKKTNFRFLNKCRGLVVVQPPHKQRFRIVSDQAVQMAHF